MIYLLLSGVSTFVFVLIIFFIKKDKNRTHNNHYNTTELNACISTLKSTILTGQDMCAIDIRLFLERDKDTIPKKSLLYYLMNATSNSLQQYYETKQEFVLRLLKTDFEKIHNISVNEFMEIYRNITDNTPEKLI